jgi:hypothetical protein
MDNVKFPCGRNQETIAAGENRQRDDGPTAQNKETNQKGHSFDVRRNRRSRRHIPAYTRERAAAMFLGSIVR